MKIDELRYPRINILHIKERKIEVQKILLKYQRLGARVNLIEVKPNPLTNQNLGKMYYYNENPKFIDIAEKIINDLKDIEFLNLQYAPLDNKKELNFSIWIVSKVKKPKNINPPKHQVDFAKDLTQKEIDSIIKSQILRSPSENLINCPKCPAQVSKKKIYKHLANIHKIRLLENSKDDQYIFKPSNNFTKKIKQKKSARNSVTENPYKGAKLGGSLATTVSGILEQIEENKVKQNQLKLKSNTTTKDSKSHKLRIESSYSLNNLRVHKLRNKGKIRRCKHCDNQAMPGEDICYSHIK